MRARVQAVALAVTCWTILIPLAAYKGASVKRCAARRAIRRTKCGAVVTHKVTAGCVHEHISEGWACDKHVSQLSNGGINCVECYKGADPHLCQLLARVEPIEPDTSAAA